MTEELSKGFTGIEINGVRFSNIKEMLSYMNKQRVRIINLENENAELDCQKNRNKACYSCANATERCFRNEIACPCQKYKSYKEENAELKEKLKPENCLKLLAKEGYIKFSSDQLTYAKTIIQDLLDNTDEYARQRAEDFLKESK